MQAELSRAASRGCGRGPSPSVTATLQLRVTAHWLEDGPLHSRFRQRGATVTTPCEEARYVPVAEGCSVTWLSAVLMTGETFRA
jgi:hypothetical protein